MNLDERKKKKKKNEIERNIRR